MYPSTPEIGERDPRLASRKRNRSQQSRSRNSSKENKKSPNKSSSLEQAKFRSRSISSISPEPSQPEYINIASIKTSAQATGGPNFPGVTPVKSDIDLSWSSKIKASNTIGPDDWYRDDFDFDKSHPFLDDPMLLKQYAQILDMKYRDSSNEKIEEILIHNSLAHQADMSLGKLGLFDGKNPSDKIVTGAGSGQFIGGKYPDSGYDTLQVDSMILDKNQMCVDINMDQDMENR